MATDLVCFAYPSLLRPGMRAGGIYQPEPLIADVITGDKYTLIVTAGLALTVGKQITTEIDILFENSSVIIDEHSNANGYLENPFSEVTDDFKVVYLSSMFVKNVTFPRHGCYTIRVSLYMTNAEGDKISPPIDQLDTYFYVSSVSGRRDGAAL
ncbi:hypothetical protein JY479_23555 [Serratia marcescens]|uniref:Uncharacterized protein n=1 Tax=Serratia marcescens TaxID=615 RepID=A0AA46K544_SERMA|nr:hypothetical protein [Serratia marcescens]MBN5322987.1 hypothetical protein [Serratia marcescens]TQI84834.1 hypothetical protein FHU12_2357 [Serratia marcescens]